MTATIPTTVAGFRGLVLGPDAPDYDRARRVWNAAVDRRPALIARCAGAADVIAAVRFGREHSLQIAVRGGGHSVPGFSTCDDGLVIDLSEMRGIRVDPQGRIAFAQPGLTWAEFDGETQAFGLATPGGEVSDTGIAGLTLGGGIGWLTRTLGLSCDNLISVDLVTAEGRLLQVDAENHPDLFWAVRGGGGNFGVVTEFRFRLHPVGEILSGPLMYPAEQAPEVLRAVQEWALSVHDQMSLNVVLATLPPVPDVPPELRGAPALLVIPAWFGAATSGWLLLDDLRRIGKPVVDAIAPTSYVPLQCSMDPMTPPGLVYHMRSDMLGRLDGAAIDTLLEHWSRISSPRSAILLRLGGGAMAAVHPAATAFQHRSPSWVMTIASVWESPTDDDAPHVTWTQDLWRAMRQNAMGVYVNYLGNEGPARIEEAYGAATRQRLATVKATYDPDNVFRLNQNIPPADA
jgi:FAD/FMN-containing dehydrogenase